MPDGMGADAEAAVGAQFLKRVEAKLAAGHEDVVARGVRGAQVNKFVNVVLHPGLPLNGVGHDASDVP